MMSKAMVMMQHHVLAVPDVAATAKWWIDVMGFEIWLEPEGWIYLSLDDCSLMLGECPDAIPPSELGDHQYFAYVVLGDVAAYHAEFVERGGAITAPVDNPWGMREMIVQTPDGHRIMFGQVLDED